MGVSVSTVSRVLNGGKYVKTELREKIEREIEALGYTPNHLARSLVLQKTNLLGVIVTDITASFFATILSSVEAYASECNYNLLVCNIAENLDKELRYLNVFKEMRVDGIILMHEGSNEAIQSFLKNLTIPVVLSSVTIKNSRFAMVNIDDTLAAYDAVSYLADLGHERIALIGGDLKDWGTGQNRYQGYQEALRDRSLPLRKEYIKFGNCKIQDGYRLMQELLECDPHPTAIFAVSDDMATGALNCIIDHGLKVPDDFSVVGFDDSALATSVRPRLTTVHQPISEIGKLSVDMLLKQINGEAVSLREIILNHHLVERESCRRL